MKDTSTITIARIKSREEPMNPLPVEWNEDNQTCNRVSKVVMINNKRYHLITYIIRQCGKSPLDKDWLPNYRV